MSAEFFKRICKQSAVGSCIFTVMLSCLYAHTITRAEYIDLSQSFYFLVSDDLHLQASTYEMQLQGGAGYLLQDEQREYVAYHVYTSLEQAQRVQSYLSQPSTIISKSVQRLCFSTNQEKKMISRVQNALACLDGCMQVLDAEITRLERGATQQSSKRILMLLNRQLRHLRNEYILMLPTAYDFILETCVLLDSNIEGIVYVKYLRYAMCLLSDGYLQLCNEYRL